MSSGSNGMRALASSSSARTEEPQESAGPSPRSRRNVKVSFSQYLQNPRTSSKFLYAEELDDTLSLERLSYHLRNQLNEAKSRDPFRVFPIFNAQNESPKYYDRRFLSDANRTRRIGERTDFQCNIQPDRAEKTTYCRPVSQRRSKEFLYKAMKERQRLQEIVKKLAEVREREKQKQAWDCYIKELKIKHGVINASEELVSSTKTPWGIDLIDSYYNTKFTPTHLNNCRNLLEDLYQRSRDAMAQGEIPQAKLINLDQHTTRYDVLSDLASLQYNNITLGSDESYLCYPTSTSRTFFKNERNSSAQSTGKFLRPNSKYHSGCLSDCEASCPPDRPDYPSRSPTIRVPVYKPLPNRTSPSRGNNQPKSDNSTVNYRRNMSNKNNRDMNRNGSSYCKNIKTCGESDNKVHVDKDHLDKIDKKLDEMFETIKVLAKSKSLITNQGDKMSGRNSLTPENVKNITIKEEDEKVDEPRQTKGQQTDEANILHSNYSSTQVKKDNVRRSSKLVNTESLSRIARDNSSKQYELGTTDAPGIFNKDPCRLSSCEKSCMVRNLMKQGSIDYSMKKRAGPCKLDSCDYDCTVRKMFSEYSSPSSSAHNKEEAERNNKMDEETTSKESWEEVKRTSKIKLSDQHKRESKIYGPESIAKEIKLKEEAHERRTSIKKERKINQEHAVAKTHFTQAELDKEYGNKFFQEGGIRRSKEIDPKAMNIIENKQALQNNTNMHEYNPNKVPNIEQYKTTQDDANMNQYNTNRESFTDKHKLSKDDTNFRRYNSNQGQFPRSKHSNTPARKRVEELVDTEIAHEGENADVNTMEDERLFKMAEARRLEKERIRQIEEQQAKQETATERWIESEKQRRSHFDRHENENVEQEDDTTCTTDNNDDRKSCADVILISADSVVNEPMDIEENYPLEISVSASTPPTASARRYSRDADNTVPESPSYARRRLNKGRKNKSSLSRKSSESLTKRKKKNLRKVDRCVYTVLSEPNYDDDILKKVNMYSIIQDILKRKRRIFYDACCGSNSQIKIIRARSLLENNFAESLKTEDSDSKSEYSDRVVSNFINTKLIQTKPSLCMKKMYSDNGNSRDCALFPNVSHIQDILKEEKYKSNKAKEDIEEILRGEPSIQRCSVQVGFELPTKETCTEVTESLSKAMLAADKSQCVYPESTQTLTIAVNTDPLSLLALLRVSRETISQLLSYVQFDYHSLLPLPNPRSMAVSLRNRPMIRSDPVVMRSRGETQLAHRLYKDTAQPSSVDSDRQKRTDYNCCVCDHLLGVSLLHQPGALKCRYCEQRFTRSYCRELHELKCSANRGKRHDIPENLAYLT